MNIFEMKFFYVVLVIMVLFSGCINEDRTPSVEENPDLNIESSQSQPDDTAMGGIEIDFHPFISNHRFWLEGSVLLTSPKSIPYVFLDADLIFENRTVGHIRYMIMDLKAGIKHSFTISKNQELLIMDGYRCALTVSGPYGVLASSSRFCQAKMEIVKPSLISPPAAEASLEDKTPRFGIYQERYKADEDDVPIGDTSTKSSENAVLDDDEDATASDSSGDSLYAYVGSKTSNKYHLPSCRYAQRISSDNLVYFKDSEDAESKGYVPCKVCLV